MTTLAHRQAAQRALFGLHDLATQASAFKLLRIGFGLIWLFNVVYQSKPAYINQLFLASLQPHAGQSQWYSAYANGVIHLVNAIGAHTVAIATIIIGAALAISLLTGLWLKYMAWVGALFTFIMWTTAGHIGGPYTQGATDPGTLIVYTLVFITIILIEPHPGATPPAQRNLSEIESGLIWRYRTVRLLFGALWLFDAAWKWTPYFIHHSASYLVAAQAGQPEWIVNYIQLYINVINYIGPDVFGYIAAVSETVIVFSLLFNIGLRYIIPFGLVYNFILWTTAEGFGGPYTSTTGVGGDVLGTAIIYCLIFLYLLIMYPPQLGIINEQPGASNST